MAYTTLFIDFDGVIRHWPASDATLETAHGLPVGALRKSAFAPERLMPAILGHISDQTWRLHIVADLQRLYPASDAHAAVAQWSMQPAHADHQTLAILNECAANLRIVLTTNATSCLNSDLRALGLQNRFHAVINSSEIGAVKPDAAFYQAALAHAKAQAHECLLIDDTLKNVQAAQALGINSHLFTGLTAMRRFLQDAMGHINKIETLLRQN